MGTRTRRWAGLLHEMARVGAEASLLTLHQPHIVLGDTDVSAASAQWTLDLLDADGHRLACRTGDGAEALRETFHVCPGAVWLHAHRVEVYRVGASADSVAVVGADGTRTVFTAA